jgi:NADH-quinone oxidoreductase subunit L
MTKYFMVLPWIVFLPLIGFLFTGIFARRLSEKVAGTIATLAIFTSFGLSVYAYWYLLHEPNPGTTYAWVLYKFLDTGFINLDIAFYLDRLSAVMVLVVTGVSSLIHLYSIGYMRGDRSAARYFSHLNMFVFFMLLLVLGKNLLVMFVGWEGVGLSSYLLIGFWFDDMSKAKAGKKAFIVNRIGDFGFLLGMFLLLMYNTGSLDIGSLEMWAASGAQPVQNSVNMTVICLLLFVGAVGKSAQIPLYVWLPDAMAGPTPVSALIHAATMVTAGVYMVARLSFLYVHAPVAMAVVAGVGALTALYAATIGIAQRDIKKVLAYSTVSQLGYMFLAVGTGAYAAGVFHLTTHAFFKACLFLGAGSVIHAMHGEQDIFKMGGLKKKMPWTHLTFLVSTLAIAGIPPFSGFFSKDQILTATFLSNTAYPGLYKVYWAMAVAGAFITAFYMMRMYWLTFMGQTRASESTFEKAHESPWTMTLPLVVLALAAATAGVLGIPGESNIFHHWLAPVVGNYTTPLAHASAAMHWGLIALSVVVAAAGLLVGYAMYRKGIDGPPARLAAAFKPIHRLVENKYYVDEIYDLLIVKPLVALARFCHRIVDVILIDTLGVNGSAFAVKALGVVPRIYHNGNVQRYLFAIVLGLVCLWIVL